MVYILLVLPVASDVTHIPANLDQIIYVSCVNCTLLTKKKKVCLHN